MRKYKAVSLFSGSGGLDLGFLQTLRFNIIYATDINKHACETYSNNIEDCCVCGEISTLKNVPHADVLIGSPPCQGFSLANPHRAFDDKRNWLFKEYRRILTECNPKVFLMENVSGMATLEKGRVFDIIYKELTDAGYCLYSEILNAADYGAPQIRKRLIIVGVRNDIEKEFRFPEPILRPSQYKTVREAFRPPIDPDDPNHKFSTLTGLNKERIRFIPQGGSMADCPTRLHNNSDLKRAMRRLDDLAPSYTIVHNNCDHYYHPTENRRISIREMARLQGYPDDFIFYGNKSEQSKQVGNSVPIQLAYHLARSVIEVLKP